VSVIALGPFAFSAEVLIWVAAVVVAFSIQGSLQRRGRVSVEAMLWWLLLATMLVARAAFVVRWWSQYAAQPSSILNVRDGGFLWWAGVPVLLLATAVLAWRRPAQRESLAWSVCGGVLLWGFASLTAQQLTRATETPLPALVLRNLDGQNVPLRSLLGKPVVLNLWATWCGPCRREMPVLAQAQRQLPGVQFVFANQGESAGVVRAFLASQKLQIDHVLLDDGMQLSQHYNAQGYPVTLFLDAHGRLRDSHMGELSAATLAEALSHVQPLPPANPGVSP
jgi:thiol-disulfide isomerase/thioredoxin